MPMNESSELQLDRLRALMQHIGKPALLRTPLITPEDHWFPDRWTPDLDSVRRLLLRLAEYASLPELGIEVELFPSVLGEDLLPTGIHPPERVSGLMAVYKGTEQGTATFAVARRMLLDPQLLVGVLAHEMAHAWRQSHGVTVADPRTEEELTDLTTIVLGFGILTCNASYQYSAAGMVRGVVARTEWSHRAAGYLSVDAMSSLLAYWGLALDIERKLILRWLYPTQRDVFMAAWNAIETPDLLDRLELPNDPSGWTPSLDRASRREFPLGRSAIALHECVAGVVSVVGENSALLPSPVPFGMVPEVGRHQALALWGHVSVHDRWSRSLVLVFDPGSATHAIVLDMLDGKQRMLVILGHAVDRTCQRRGELAALLRPLFAAASHGTAPLVPSIPTFAILSTNSALSDRELETLLRAAAGRFDANILAAETTWLQSHAPHTGQRLLYEREGQQPPAGTTTRGDATGSWWRTITNGQHSQAELAWLGTAPEK